MRHKTLSDMKHLQFGVFVLCTFEPDCTKSPVAHGDLTPTRSMHQVNADPEINILSRSHPE
jgi:hypothetical protein